MERMRKGLVFGILSVIFLLFAAGSVSAISNEGKAVVLAYHSWFKIPPCGYLTNSGTALEQDLEIIAQMGFSIVPLHYIVEWAIGERDGSSLPDKIVGITFDDGINLDWEDLAGQPCGYLKSFRTILQEFSKRHPEQQWLQASSFVIASPTIRKILADFIEASGILVGYPNLYMSDSWWAEAEMSGLIKIYNHSLDHDHSAITQKMWDPQMNVYMPTSGYATGDWVGRDEWYRNNNYAALSRAVVNAGRYIKSKIGVWPDLFATPYNNSNSYLEEVFWPLYQSEHKTIGCFVGSISSDLSGNYISRKSNRWKLPRFAHGTNWRAPEEFINVLQGALTP